MKHNSCQNVRLPHIGSWTYKNAYIHFMGNLYGKKVGREIKGGVCKGDEKKSYSVDVGS